MDFTIKGFKGIAANTTNVHYNRRGLSKIFVCNSHPGLTKHLLDFICNSSFKIDSVIRDIDTLVFTIGDYLNLNHNQSNRITDIKITNGICHLHCGPDNVNIVNAIRGIVPIPTPVPVAAPVVRATPTQPISTNSNESTLTAIQRNIEGNTPALRLEKTRRDRRGQTLLSFLTDFFKDWNNEDGEIPKNTLLVSDGSVQTECGKRRSLGDLFMICKYYYPTITVKHLLKLLYVDLKQELQPGFRSSRCTQINKRVWYYDVEQRNATADKTWSDEFGKRYNDYLPLIEVAEDLLEEA